MSTIWIINQYASTPATDTGGRHRHLARELAARGHRVYLIAASWHHLLRDGGASEAAPFIEEMEGFSFVRIPTPRYAHAHDKRRMLNWLLFAWRVAGLHRRIPKRPDVIMCSSPSLFAVLGAERLARRFGARLVFEVRDIWPLTLIEVGGQSPRHPAIRLMQWIEDRAYSRADRVVSNLPAAVEHMTARGMDRRKFAWIPNGFSMKDVAQPVPLPPAVLASFPQAKFVVGYAGTLGVANALETFLDAAELSLPQKDVAFVLVGGGREKVSLIDDAARRGLTNVHFLDPVPKAMVQSAIERFDVCYIGWRESALYRFGIAANKLFDYLYSGRPIIHSFSGRHDPVHSYGAGLTVEAGNPTSLAEAVLQLRDAPHEERRRLGSNGRRAALEHHEYGTLAQHLEEVLVGELPVGLHGSADAGRSASKRRSHA